MDEFELTYLSKYLPRGVFAAPAKELRDCYIPPAATHPDLRVRRVGDVYEITRKRPLAAFGYVPPQAR